MFINAIIVFIIVALVLFFIVKAYMKTQKPAVEVVTKDCPYCFTDIPLAATRCPDCTSELPAESLTTDRSRRSPGRASACVDAIRRCLGGGALERAPPPVYTLVHHDRTHDPASEPTTSSPPAPATPRACWLDELRALGAAEPRETRGGVAFTGPLPLAYRACLWSRVASRVLHAAGLLPRRPPSTSSMSACTAMPWEDHLKVDGTLAVETTSTIRQGPLATVNTHFVEQRVKDAVVDRFRARTGRRPGRGTGPARRPHQRPSGARPRPSSASTSPGTACTGGATAWKAAGAAQGEPGRRHPAPRGLAGRRRRRAAPLLDPMCGSGTLLIEGALMAADIAPGLLRDYSASSAGRASTRRSGSELLAEAAERRAGGADRAAAALRFRRRCRARSAPPAPTPAEPGWPGASSSSGAIWRRSTAPHRGQAPGLVVTNPPYGKRLGEVAELAGLYETLGERLKAVVLRVGGGGLHRQPRVDAPIWACGPAA